jgi:hypothetical protein
LGERSLIASSRASARFYLQNVVFPMIDGLVKEKISFEEQVTNPIRSGETLRKYADKPELQERFDETLGNPAVRLLIGRFRSHL